MADAIFAKWKQVEFNNFDNYLKSIKVAPEFIELALKNKPTVEYKKNGNKVSIHTEVGQVKHDIEFELDKEFDEPRLDGKITKCTYKVDGNTLLQTGKVEDGTESTCVREVQGNNLILTYKHGGVTGTIKFEKA
jgi:hypothetical protein